MMTPYARAILDDLLGDIAPGDQLPGTGPARVRQDVEESEIERARRMA